MRSAPASRPRSTRLFESRGFVLASVALLGAGIGACSSDAARGPVPDSGAAASDASDVRADVASDVRADVASDVNVDMRPDIGPDLPPPPNLLCSGVPPTADFSDPYVVANFDGQVGATFGGPGEPASGGTYISAGLTQDFTDSSWHLTGTVAGNEHFGIYWMCSLPSTSGGCTLDLSRFKGIRFKVKGNAGPDHAMALSLGRAQNDPQTANAGCGSCNLPAGSDADVTDYCRGPRAEFNVPADGSQRTVTILWTDFVNGSPFESIDPHQVTGMLWLFHLPATPDGGADAGADAATDAPVDAPADGALADAAAIDASADGVVIPDAGAASSDAGPSFGYLGDVTVDDIELVPY